MTNEYSVEELLEFLAHAGDRGMMPKSTASSLRIAVRNVLGILDETESKDVRKIDVDTVVKRFANKRAKDFSPGSLREYGMRTKRSVEMFIQWRNDPTTFSVKTRQTIVGRRAKSVTLSDERRAATDVESASIDNVSTAGGYQTAFPIRAGQLVTIANLPTDLTRAEADRLAQFVLMLVAD